jgi:hypothetical protein
MSKEQFTSSIKEINLALSRLDSEFSKSSVIFIVKQDKRREVELIATKWFEDVEPFFLQYRINDETKGKYYEAFTKLLRLSLQKSRKDTYQRTIKLILAGLKHDILIPSIQYSGQITSIANLANILSDATAEEKEYLNEAIGCANRGFMRASMVLLWCAAVHRMQKIVEKLGIEEFNRKSEEMQEIKEGRFKRFKKSFNIHSLSELRASVFDTTLLWVLEYWCLIDANQHSRLEICFTMRNNAAHPGDAIVTAPNLASAFSDIKAIIFDNPKFRLTEG